jgi:hypothetical protein
MPYILYHRHCLQLSQRLEHVFLVNQDLYTASITTADGVQLHLVTELLSQEIKHKTRNPIQRQRLPLECVPRGHDSVETGPFAASAIRCLLSFAFIAPCGPVIYLVNIPLYHFPSIFFRRKVRSSSIRLYVLDRVDPHLSRKKISTLGQVQATVISWLELDYAILIILLILLCSSLSCFFFFFFFFFFFLVVNDILCQVR